MLLPLIKDKINPGSHVVKLGATWRNSSQFDDWTVSRKPAFDNSYVRANGHCTCTAPLYIVPASLLQISCTVTTEFLHRHYRVPAPLLQSSCTGTTPSIYEIFTASTMRYDDGFDAKRVEGSKTQVHQGALCRLTTSDFVANTHGHWRQQRLLTNP